ncbi:MAG: tRNA preQ1(34) S-adenosylmethionine ribosyltransferase-isomerase QueA [Termitinemataceae bacterium]|nr:MAG: tRNA preQ1(34) S-adenosylmethionine ribosyltransferase-isomerase QueA [Termitinemataceae bacterium]
MKTKDFYFKLPQNLIAQYPVDKRGCDKLLVLDRITGNLQHRLVRDLPQLIPRGSLLVFNNSKVRKARIYGTAKDTGKIVEFLLLRPSVNGFSQWLVMLKKSRKIADGSRFVFPANVQASLSGEVEKFRLLHFDNPIDEQYLEQYGYVPLPPYIKRNDQNHFSFDDETRYQTIYAKNTGSVASPTAGLHWTDEMFAELKERGIETTFVTLHVGGGTFLPVRSENVEDHTMHKEYFFIDNDSANKIERAKTEGRPLIAVGTTTLRTLESAWQNGKLVRGESSTSIFIYGDYQFKTAESLFTNFHTPESTLLMLVSSFAGAHSNAEHGRKMIFDAYNEAIKNNYKFFSYGDAMLIL